jgi:hypothetical protein
MWESSELSTESQHEARRVEGDIGRDQTHLGDNHPLYERS